MATLWEVTFKLSVAFQGDQPLGGVGQGIGVGDVPEVGVGKSGCSSDWLERVMGEGGVGRKAGEKGGWMGKR